MSLTRTIIIRGTAGSGKTAEALGETFRCLLAGGAVRYIDVACELTPARMQRAGFDDKMLSHFEIIQQGELITLTELVELCDSADDFDLVVIDGLGMVNTLRDDYQPGTLAPLPRFLHRLTGRTEGPTILVTIQVRPTRRGK